jgi:integrase
MASISRLVRRNGLFYYRMATPRRLAAHLGRKELKLSLRTRDPLEARVRARLLSNAFDVLFAGATMPQMSAFEINERVKSYFQAALNQSLEHSQLLPSDPAVDLAHEVAFLREHVDQLRQHLARQVFTPTVVADAEELVTEMQTTAGSPAKPDREALQLACNGVMRAQIENARILAAQLEGRYDETAPRDPLFAGMQATGLPAIDNETAEPGSEMVTFEELGSRYYRFKKAGGAADKTLIDIERVNRIAQDVIDPAQDVKRLDDADIRRMRDHVASLKANADKFKEGGENQPLKTVSIVTQEKYFRFFKALIRWGVDEGYIAEMPGEKIKIAGASKVKSIEQRRPYSDAQLKAIFGSTMYTGCESVVRRHRPGEKIIRDGHWWIPLIGLYTGLRLGEIVQLATADVKDEAGILFFDITTEGDEGKRLKTASSKRRVPVPAVLMNLGFGEVLKRADPKRRLFEEVEIGETGFPSHAYSKWWGRYARVVGFQEERTAFHSFRHNFADGLTAASVSDAIGKAIMGHADASTHALYGSKPPLPLLKLAIDKISFPAVDLAKLALKP